jgi:hypothetical protein
MRIGDPARACRERELSSHFLFHVKHAFPRQAQESLN